MVAYEAPTTQINYRTAAMAVTDPHGSSASVSSAVPVQEWRSHSEGGGIVGNKLAGWPGNMQVLQVPSLAAPKPESLHLYGEGEDESTEFDYSLLHGRKRSKLHDSLPAAAVIQNHPMQLAATSSSLAILLQENGIGEPTPYKSIDSQHSFMSKMGRMLPPVLVSVPSSAPCDPLEEPSPLGLTLKKTPSLLDLIAMQLAHSKSASDASSCEVIDPGFCKSGKIHKCSAPAGNAAPDKLKASNFPASSLKIGTWECVSRYEGDLVTKCYYAKRKLVWEVLDSGLKSKIEIQWSDISAMKAMCPESLPGSLEISVSRPPLFFKETNPQPRKHTLWQATSDFTGGQATTCKWHSLQYPEGVLNKHYEKLLQCDPRLKALVEGTLVIGPSPFFEHSDYMFEGQSAVHLPKTLSHSTYAFEGFNYQPQPLLSPYSFLQGNCKMTGVVPESTADSRLMDMHMSNMSSPSSGLEIQASNEDCNSDSDEYPTKEEFPTSTPFAAVNSNLSPMCYDEDEQKPSLNDFSGSSNVSASNRKILDEIAHILLGDSSTTLSNEQALLLAARMGSMQAVLARDFQTGPVSHPQAEGFVSDEQHSSPRLPNFSVVLDSSFNMVMQCLSMNNSTRNLLMSLPRVASLPQLF
ncbi:unnamed protein product [Sphagnum jensenii]|uniref:TRF2/HOY1 PH-like domain-containing protein n=1 Tax=Sphagnum jensenii TaxID=128206 RepID=A0ABP0VRQ3_9BRYO